MAVIRSWYDDDSDADDTAQTRLITDGGEPDADVSEQSATREEIEAWDEENDEPHPVFDVPHRPERQKVVIDRPDYADRQSLSVYNVATWGELTGMLVKHDEHGVGEVTRPNDMSREAWVQFDDGLHTSHFDDLELVAKKRSHDTDSEDSQ